MLSSLPLLHTAMPTPCLNTLWHSHPYMFFEKVFSLLSVIFFVTDLLWRQTPPLSRCQRRTPVKHSLAAMTSLVSRLYRRKAWEMATSPKYLYDFTHSKSSVSIVCVDPLVGNTQVLAFLYIELRFGLSWVEIIACEHFKNLPFAILWNSTGSYLGLALTAYDKTQLRVSITFLAIVSPVPSS